MKARWSVMSLTIEEAALIVYVHLSINELGVGRTPPT